MRTIQRPGFGQIVILAVSAPTWLLGYAYVGLALALGLAHRFRVEGEFVAVATWRPWWAKRWRYSTTVGRGMCLSPGSVESERIWQHEMVHVRQTEDACAQAALAGLALWAADGMPWWGGLALWVIAPASLAVNLGTSALRHGLGGAYRQSEHERAAYSGTDHFPD